MQFAFEAFVEEANAAKSVEELKSLFLKALKQHGLDRFVLCFDTDHNDISIKAGSGIVENVCPEFMAYYQENQLDKIDPVLMYSRIQPLPFRWTDTFENMHMSKKQANIIHTAIDSGLYQGMYFPQSRGNCHAGIGLASSLKSDNFSGQFDLVNAYCKHFYESFIRLNTKKPSAKMESWLLTMKETEILTWVARGKTDSQIALIMLISNNTVETHLRNIYSKLEVRNRPAAVATAMSKKLIRY